MNLGRGRRSRGLVWCISQTTKKEQRNGYQAQNGTNAMEKRAHAHTMRTTGKARQESRSPNQRFVHKKPANRH